jgi:TPR repeat protein
MENNKSDDIKKYKVGADHGNLGCIMIYADYCENEKKYDEMETYYKLAAEQNEINAMKRLVIYYYDNKMFDSMITYCQKLYENKILSDHDLGAFYMLGKDLKNLKLAAKHLVSACQQGNVKAMILLSNIYSEAKDYDGEIKYLKMAANKNSTEAMFKLGEIYENKKLIKEAKKYYEEAANSNHEPSKEKLKSYKKNCVIL